MTSDGREYDRAFEEACATLPYEPDEDAVRAELEGIEWMLWRAVRGALIFICFLIAGVLMAIIVLTVDAMPHRWLAVIFVGGGAVVFAGLYWFCRLVFHLEIASHVKGRRFGSGGLEM